MCLRSTHSDALRKGSGSSCTRSRPSLISWLSPVQASSRAKSIATPEVLAWVPSPHTSAVSRPFPMGMLSGFVGQPVVWLCEPAAADQGSWLVRAEALNVGLYCRTGGWLTAAAASAAASANMGTQFGSPRGQLLYTALQPIR